MRQHGLASLVLVATLIFGYVVVLMIASIPSHEPQTLPLAPAPPPLAAELAAARAEAAAAASAVATRCAPFPACALPPRAPAYYPLCELLDDWSPNEPDAARFATSRAAATPLPRFDYSAADEREAAEAYRRAELPFVLYGLTDLDAAAAEWSDEFLREAFASTPRENYKIERAAGAEGNQFLYYSLKQAHAPAGWEPPQETVRDATYAEFDAAAARASATRGRGAGAGRGDAAGAAAEQLLYLTVSATMGGRTKWIRDALRFFSPVGLGGGRMFNVERAAEWHGINCRFGMRGVVQAAHYDSKRNFIAMVRGAKRYVIQPPSACDALELLHPGHPSSRHASFDWADAAERAARARAPFCASDATELVLRAGEVLYLPSYWFHYIVSLDRSAQCNTRSGHGEDGRDAIKACGFIKGR